MNARAIDIHGTPHEVKQGSRLEFKVFARFSGKRFLVMASGDGDLFNPNNQSDQIGKKDTARGGMFFKLRACSKECYENYVTFLRTKNHTHYVLAQRRFSHDI